MTVVDGNTLSSAELVALVEGPAIYVDAGLDLLDGDDNLIESLSASEPGETGDFVADGSSVERGIYRTIHGTATLLVTREVVWGAQRLRPTLLLSSDGATWYRWSRGVFLPTVPERVAADSPALWSVSCMDKLDILNTEIRGTIGFPAGTNVVEAVADLIVDAGESKVNLDASGETLANPRVFSVVDDWTLLGVVNELLGSIGHQAVHVDREGWYRSSAYVSPADRATVWSYSADSSTTTVSEVRTSIADYYRAANIVRGINDAVSGTIPVDNDGLFELENETDGVTSTSQRAGRQIVRKIRGQYTSQSALETAVREILDNEKRVATYITASVSPTPVHGHFDVVNYRDDVLGIDGRYLVTNWTQPLGGADLDVSLSLRSV